MSKEELIEHLYGYSSTPNLNAIETYVGRLRRSLSESNVEIKPFEARLRPQQR
ncbi:hypothetical protein JCM19233_6870 [Vibrio astriarenae]|nr:hypothetical protein JCM19233_6870 [Vibrio sp. C7]